MFQDLDHTSFYLSVRDASFPVSQFDHKAHIRLAWICQKQEPLEAAIKTIIETITNYVKHYGAEDKYHETLTIASAKIIHQALIKNAALDFDEFVNHNPALINDFKSLVAIHYSDNVLQSTLARKEYIAPDRLPFEIIGKG